MEKKYLKSIILAIFIAISLNASAQKQFPYQFEIHKEFKTDEREIPEQFIGSNEFGHYFLYSKGKYGQGESTLVKFNNNFQPTNEKIKLTERLSFGDDIYLQDDVIEESLGVIKLDDILYNISSVSTKKHRTFYVKTIDLSSFTVSDKKEIATIKIEGYNVQKSYMSFLLSRDSTSLGLFYTVPTKKNENRKFSLKVFNKQFNEINHFNYEFPYASKQFVITNGFLLNSNEMIILKADYSKMPVNAYSKKIPDYKYALYSLKNEDSQLIGKVSNDNKWLHNIKLHLSDSTIKIIGLYANIGKFNSYGIFYHKINLSNNEVIHKLTPFTQEALDDHIAISNLGIGIKKITKKHKELPYYVTQSPIEFNDGCLMLFSEQMHTYTQYVTTYYYKNILVNMIDNDGNVLWTKVIKKDNSKTGTPTYSSYVLSKNKDQCYVAYNGNPKNLINGNTRRYKAFGDNEDESIILSIIDKSGKITKSVIAHETETQGYRIRPGLSSWINDNRILFFSQKPGNVKNQKFMTLSLDAASK